MIQARDLMWIAQVAKLGALLLVPPPGPAVKVMLVAGLAVTISGAPGPMALPFGVVSAHPGVAEHIEGLDVDFTISGATESHLMSPTSKVVGGLASVDLVGQNIGPSDDVFAVDAAVSGGAGVDNALWPVFVGPNCTPSCTDSEWQICSDSVADAPGGKCLSISGEIGSWTQTTAEGSAISTAHRCNYGDACGFLPFNFETDSSSGTPFAVWVRLRYQSNAGCYCDRDCCEGTPTPEICDNCETYFIRLTDDSGTVNTVRVYSADMANANCAGTDNPCAIGCQSQDTDLCWVRVTPRDGMPLANGVNTLQVATTAVELSNGTQTRRYFDGYIYTTDLNYVPTEPIIDPACASDADFNAGVCGVPSVNWGPNQFTGCPCGNCRLDGSEACDDGNTTPGGGFCASDCSQSCNESCGDGSVQAVCDEDCDAWAPPPSPAPPANKRGNGGRDEGMHVELRDLGGGRKVRVGVSNDLRPRPVKIHPDWKKIVGPSIQDIVDNYRDREARGVRSEEDEKKFHASILFWPSENSQRADGWDTVRDESRRQRDELLEACNPEEYHLFNTSQMIPSFHGMFTPNCIEKIVDDMSILSIKKSKGGYLELGNSIPMIGGVGASGDRFAGHFGTNVGVAVLDSGVLAKHDYFEGHIVHEECFCQNASALPCCPGGTTRQTGPGAALDDTGHGTHVTGVILSDGNGGDDVGMAPRGHVVAIKIGGAIGGTEDKAIEGFDWILNSVARGNPHRIRVINMSISTGGPYFSDTECNQNEQTWAIRIQQARALGLLLVASSSNQCQQAAMRAPACVEDVVSVGAVYSYPPCPGSPTCDGGNNFGAGCPTSDPLSYQVADNVPNFSNALPSLDLLAPGCLIFSADKDAQTDSAGRCGTSMAAPHVSGLAAMMFATDPTLTPQQVLKVMKHEAIMVDDTRSGCTAGVDCPQFPRIRADEAVQAVTRNQLTCSANCKSTCPTGFVWSGAECVPPCGDGVWDDGETCDPARAACNGTGVPCDPSLDPSPCAPDPCLAIPGDDCSETCQFTGSDICGDGVQNPLEQCDIGSECDAFDANAGTRCDQNFAVCSGGGPSCLDVDVLRSCMGGPDLGQWCVENTECDTSSCGVSLGYCVACLVNPQ